MTAPEAPVPTTGPARASAPVIEWLLDADPAIRWQVMRDLLDVPPSQWSAERDKVEAQGHSGRRCC